MCTLSLYTSGDLTSYSLQFTVTLDLYLMYHKLYLFQLQFQYHLYKVSDKYIMLFQFVTIEILRYTVTDFFQINTLMAKM